MWSHRRWKYTPPTHLDAEKIQGDDDSARFANGRDDDATETPEMLINPEPTAKKA